MHSLVKDLMTTQVVTVGPATPFKEIVARLAEHRVSAVPVVDDDGRVLGVVSEARTRLLREQGGKVPPKHGNGDGADGRVGVDRRRPEAPRLRRSETGRQKTSRVFAQPGGLKAASGTQPFHERLKRRTFAFPPP